MPTVTEETVKAWAHCTFARCLGNEQEPVIARRRETAHTYRERGGDAPGVEYSSVDLVFEDDEQRPCSHCGRPRDLSATPRTTYAPISGHDPNGLLGVPEFKPNKQGAIPDPERERLEQENRELRERLEAKEA